MRQKFKISFFIIGVSAFLILLLAGSFLYTTKYKYTGVDSITSPDGRCQLTLQIQGEPEWPFGTTYGRIIAGYDGETIKKIKISVRDDGKVLRSDNWKVEWGPAGAQITLLGSEQNDRILQILIWETGVRPDGFHFWKTGKRVFPV